MPINTPSKIFFEPHSDSQGQSPYFFPKKRICYHSRASPEHYAQVVRNLPSLESNLLFLMGNYDRTIGHESVVQFIRVRNKILLDTNSTKIG